MKDAHTKPSDDDDESLDYFENLSGSLDDSCLDGLSDEESTNN